MIRNNIFLLSVISCIFFLVACGNKANKGSEQEGLDTLWNAKVQDTFYGATFGEPTDNVISQLEAQGFSLQEDISTDALLHFRPQNCNVFTFGDMSWQMLDVFTSNKVFTGIRFMNAYVDKASAEAEYDTTEGALASKYRLTNKTPKDTTIYNRKLIFGRNNVIAVIRCFRYETISHNIMIANSLEYYSNQNYGVNDDL